MHNKFESTIVMFYVAIYIRLSKEDDNLGESESVQNQKKLLTNYIESLGEQYKIVDIYIDDGFTGTNFNRPAFQRMLSDIESGKVNMVITKDLSRLSRDYIGTGEYVEKWFPAHRVRYVALTDNIDTFVDSSNNDIAPFKAILNDMYAKDMSKKIRTALHTMQQDGKWVGGCTPFGYKPDPADKNHLIIDEQEGEIIKKIFSLFLSGKRINQIRDILNDEQIPTFSSMRGRNFQRNGNNGSIYGYWCNTTIKKILSNRLYTGDMIQNRRSRISYKYRKLALNPIDKWIIVENTHEPLISKEDFELVQKALPAQKTRSDKKELFLLDGLLKCADCGHNIGIRARRPNGKTTTICNYYRKYNVKYKLCTNHGIDYDTLEQGVIDKIKDLLKFVKKENIEKKVLSKYEDDNSYKSIKQNIEKLTLEINTINSNLDKSYMDNLSGKITDEMFLRISEKLNCDIKNKKDKLEELENYIKDGEGESNDLENIKNEIEDFLNLKTPTRELMIKLINHIDIHEDKTIDIHFNCNELNIIYDNCVA